MSNPMNSCAFCQIHLSASEPAGDHIFHILSIFTIDFEIIHISNIIVNS